MAGKKMNTKLKKGIFSAVAVVVLIAAVIAVNICLLYTSRCV